MSRRNRRARTKKQRKKKPSEPEVCVTEQNYAQYLRDEPGEGLEDSLSLIFETSYKSRELGYRALLYHLSKSFEESFVEKSQATITSAIKNSFRKGKNGEKFLAARSFALTCITLGVASENIFLEMKETLTNMVEDLLDQPATASACLESLALTCFVGAQAEEDTIQILKFIFTLFAKKKTNFSSHAIDAWTLLLTTVSPRKVVQDIAPECLPLFYTLIDHGDVTLRIAAAEAIAVICSIASRHFDFDSESYNTDWMADIIDVDQLLDKLYDQISATKKFMSKQEQKREKEVFKSVQDMVMDGVETEHKMVLRSEPVTLYGWPASKQFDFIRNILGTGLQTHFEENDLLSDIFGVSLHEGGKVRLSKVEKRLLKSPNSPQCRGRSQQRAYDRGLKHRENHAYLYDA